MPSAGSLRKEKIMISISKEDFGTLCICAVRYSMGRRTYMPSMVQNIVREHLSDLSENDINVLLQDKAFQARMDMYGDPCDKADWLKFWDDVEKYASTFSSKETTK